MPAGGEKEEIIEVELSQEERDALLRSVEEVRKGLESLRELKILQ